MSGNTAYNFKLRGDRMTFEVGASQTIYRGGIVVGKGDGYGYAGTNAVGVQVLGVAEEEADNSSGSAGDITVEVRRKGIMRVTPKYTARQCDIGLRAYLKQGLTSSQDQEIARYGEVVHDVVIGTIVDVDVSEGYWFVDLLNFSGESAELGFFGIKYGNGVPFPISADSGILGAGTSDVSGWQITVVDANPDNAHYIQSADAEYQALKIHTDDSENDGLQMQMAGENVQCDDDKPLQFKARLKISAATQSDFFFGIGNTDTSFIAAHPQDALGFESDDGDLNIDCEYDSADGDNTDDSDEDLTDATYVTLGGVWDGTNFGWYIDGAQIQTKAESDGAPVGSDTALMTLTLAFLTGAAAAIDLTVSTMGLVAKK